MREFQVFTAVCTFHLANANQKVAGVIPVPVTLIDLPNGGFTLTYNPSGNSVEAKNPSKVEASEAWACRDCADKVIPKLQEQKAWVEAKIVKAVEHEAAYEEEKPEALEEEAEEPGPVPDGAVLAGLAKQTPAESAGKVVNDAIGDKVNYVPAPGLMDKIIANAAHRVSNPEADQVDPDAKIPDEEPGVIEEWMTHFPTGYKPTADQPRGDEKEACSSWFIKLPAGRKRELAPKGWPVRGSLTKALVVAWHKTPEFAEFKGYKSAVSA